MSALNMLKLSLEIGAVLGCVFAFIFANTIEYWIDIKKYGKEAADEIRKRW